MPVTTNGRLADVRPDELIDNVVLPLATAVTVAEPPEVCPSGMVIDVGAIVAMDVSATARLRVIPPVGAGRDSVMAKLCETLVGSEIELTTGLPTLTDSASTVTGRVAVLYPLAVALTDVAPAATPVRVKLELLCPAGTVIDSVTFAAAGLLLVNVITSPPAGAGSDKVMGMDRTRPGVTTALAGIANDS